MLAAVLAAVAVHAAIGLVAWSRTEAGSVESTDEPVSVEIVFEAPVTVTPAENVVEDVTADRPPPEQTGAATPPLPVEVTAATSPSSSLVQRVDRPVVRPLERPPTTPRPATKRKLPAAAEPTEEKPPEETSGDTSEETSRELAPSPVPAATATLATDTPTSDSEAPAPDAPVPGPPLADAAETPLSGTVARVENDRPKEPAADASHKAGGGGETGGGGPDAGPSRAALVASYGRIVWTQVLAHRPVGLRRTGSTRLSFTIAPDGALLSAGIARSSGSDGLDQLALGTLRDAAPFPPPPPALQSAPLMFVIAFEFR